MKGFMRTKTALLLGTVLLLFLLLPVNVNADTAPDTTVFPEPPAIFGFQKVDDPNRPAGQPVPKELLPPGIESAIWAPAYVGTDRTPFAIPERTAPLLPEMATDDDSHKWAQLRGDYSYNGFQVQTLVSSMWNDNPNQEAVFQPCWLRQTSGQFLEVGIQDFGNDGVWVYSTTNVIKFPEYHMQISRDQEYKSCIYVYASGFWVIYFDYGSGWYGLDCDSGVPASNWAPTFGLEQYASQAGTFTEHVGSYFADIYFYSGYPSLVPWTGNIYVEAQQDPLQEYHYKPYTWTIDVWADYYD